MIHFSLLDEGSQGGKVAESWFSHLHYHPRHERLLLHIGQPKGCSKSAVSLNKNLVSLTAASTSKSGSAIEILNMKLHLPVPCMSK